MKICLLGSLAVTDDDGNVRNLSGARLQTLMTALALRCGEVVNDDHLLAALWGDAEPSRSANALQRQVSTLRRALGSPDLVQRRGAGYVLALDRCSVDIFRFDALTARGHDAMREGNASRARDLFEEALRLWRGDALADVMYEEFAQPDIGRLNEARLDATEARIDADLLLGRDSGMISEIECLVRAHPLREHLRAQLMLALSRSGRQAEALRSYQSAREVLGEHLGLEPSRELRALEAAILQQEDAVVRRDAPVASPPRTNLRTPLTSIIGRRGAMRALRPLLRAHRLVTLVGPGGVGKSRLVLEAAREWFDSDEGDVWMVEFADVGDTNGVAAAILATLDVARAGEAQGDIRRLIEFLGKRRAVLVFDNCEHLVASAAHVAQELLESCPTLTIWATSREGLSIPGEVLWPVPPLVLDDAVALFIERGLAADPVGAFGDDSAPARRALEEICTRLDGLPLAIELAAARLRTIPIGELTTGLEDRFRILNRGARTALPRQQTLRAVVDWSYDLLFDDERRVFDRLSVFRGSCTLAAAKAVCSDDDITGDDVTDLVSRLADKSLALIQSDELGGYARCRMLQTLVEYGRERLEESGDAARVYAAHGRYYSDFASRSVAALTGLKQRGWLRAVTGNLDNLRSAFDVALAEGDAETAQCIAGGLGWYWWFTGRALEGSQWLMHARGCAGEVRPLTQARVKAWTGFARTPGFVRWAESEESPYWLEVPVSGPMLDEEVDELCNDACKLYREVDAFDELAGVEIALAVAYSTRGGHDRAIELLIDAEQLLAGTDTEPHLRAMRHFAAARRAFIADEHDAAESAFRRSIELLEQTGADVHRAFAFRYLGRLAAIRGEFSESVTAIEHALKLASELSLTGFANVLMSDLGESLGLSGDFARARAVLEQPLTTARDVGFLPGIGQSLAALATLERRAGDCERAARLAKEALDIAVAADDDETLAHCLATLGLVAALQGDLVEARAWHRRGLELATRSDQPRRTALALEGRANVALLEHENRLAVRLLGAASALRRSPGRAAGSAYAVGARIDAERLLAAASEALGPEIASRTFQDGAADPQSTVAALIATD